MAVIVLEVISVIFRGSLHKNHTLLLHPGHKTYTAFVFLDKIKNPDENFVSLINRKILKENIILLINEGNYSFDNHKIIINSNYNMFEINLNTIGEKPDILRIYFPKKCGNKI